MFNSGILDVAIGLVFIFLLLSLICSAISEMIEVLLKKRASDLQKGIREFLNDKDGTGLAKDVYNHPLVFGLFKGDYNPQKSSNLPSYIPSRNFALALMDTILPAGEATVSGAAGATIPPAAAAPSPPSGGTAPTESPTDQTKVPEAAGATVSPAAAAPSPTNGGTPPTPLKRLRDAIASCPNEQVKKALLTLVDAAGNDVSKARENIEGWFDSSMERITGWYKRRSQWIILVLGLAVAVAVNADTITIARSLSSDAAMRNSLVEAAQEYAKAPPAPGQEAMTAEARLKKSQEAIQKLGLPIGWNLGKEKDERSIPLFCSFPSWAWFFKIFGWVLTAMAISLGAPFWFDLLNKFMSARSTLKPSKEIAEVPKKA